MYLGLAVAPATWYNVKKTVLEQNRYYAIDSFENVCILIDEMESAANSIATHILVDNTYKDVLFNAEVDYDVISASRITKQLSLMEDLDENIESIYLYNSEAQLLVSNQVMSLEKENFTGFIDFQILDIINEYESYSDEKFLRRLMPTVLPPNYVIEKEVYTYFLDYFKRGELYSAVIVNISVDSLRENILKMKNMQNSYMAICDESQNLIFEAANNLSVNWDNVQALVADMVERGQTYQDFWQDGERYFMLHLVSEDIGWDYVKVGKWDDVFSVQRRIRNTFVLLVFVIIVLALLISKGAAFLIYRPYMKIEKNYRKLLKESKRQYHTLKDEFLFDFINGKKIYSTENLDNLLEKYELVKEGYSYTLAILKIDNYENLIDQFGADWVQSIKFGFRNVFEEIGNNYFFTLGISYPEDVILFIFGTEQKSIQRELKEIFFDFCEKEKIFIEWDFRLMTIGEYVAFEKLPDLKDKMWLELENLFFYESGSLVQYEDLYQQYKKTLDYGKLDQKPILEALYSGKRKEVEKSLEKIQTVLQNSSATDYRNALMWISFSIAHVINEYGDDMPEENMESGRMTGNECIRQISNCDTIVQANQILMNFFDEALKARENVATRTPIYDKMEDVKIYIDREFRNPNLSQDLLADEFGISSPYLGRQYKKYTGVSVSEYISRIRLDTAAKQIRETQKPIKNIASECGFGTANYFYTFFKKKMGVTPQAYRDKEIG